MLSVTWLQSVWNVSQCRSKKGERASRGPSGAGKALIVNGRGSKNKMIASLSLAAAAAERSGGEISRAITRHRPTRVTMQAPRAAGCPLSEGLARPGYLRNGSGLSRSCKQECTA